MDSPLVSIIIPCYNQARFLQETVESVINQTYTNWECLIIDDGSTDDCKAVSESLCQQDSRIQYIYQANKGLSGARNTGLVNAKGDFIQFLDADDLIASNKVERQLQFANTCDVIVAHHTMFIDSLNNCFENQLSKATYNLTADGFLYRWGEDFVIAIHSGLFRKSFLIQNDIQFNETVNAREDWLFWCELAMKGARFFEIYDVLAYYRVHNASMTRDKERMVRSLIEAILIQYDNVASIKKDAFRKEISRAMIRRLDAMYVDKQAVAKAQSIDYKVGYYLLWPLHRISSLIRKLAKKKQCSAIILLTY